MNKIEYAIKEVHNLDFESKKENSLNKINPLIKLIITITYIAFITSIDKYNLVNVIYMSIYLILVKIIGDISLKKCIRRLKIVFTFVLIIGLINPIFDKEIIFYVGTIPISYGVVSMFTLVFKGCFSIIASYFLIVTTRIENICVALKMIHIPNILITVIMLIYRYIIVFLKEVQRIWTAYLVRAPKQKGVNIKAWGSLIGSLVLRTIDTANNVYNSMELRGFDVNTFFDRREKFFKKDFLYLIIGIIVLIIIRFIPVFELIGNVFI